ncbi:NAD(P) transhydrogenase subunit alpha [Aureibacter tunicatorum]|uniref:proton-translocating NAD(P)(+) transhydrogenase n=1 Tax=Aureibacter tunicatorum TaxID=866807 RepID=A0AAE3XIR8_9BACT|nr:NAD(P) transhydrogenase subunit alpha [Aureibacter tunicatorum]MDR6237157.1 NAD(P) transhydrogenase subunit alpha [Aureibacter tunicatorum]BDD06149.1 NAD(P) transhydrogenase subunit alpha [Aureibacter tunicatorum]
MQLGILKELSDNRVSISPESVKKLSKSYEIVVEKDAGISAFFSNEDYEAVGAKSTSRDELLKNCDIVFSINPPSLDDLGLMKKNAIIVSQFSPFNQPEIAEQIAQLGISALSMDMIPRTTLAQAMDVLSSMASIAGYRAVLKASDYFPRYIPMLSTAAGTIPPAKALILGAGVAGLQAIATAKRLGAVVEVFDTRAAAKEEVMSLGAKFIEVEGATDDKAAGGYAVEQTEDYKKKQAELIAEKASKADIIITTALLRGRPAPLLLPKSTLDNMKPGSVIVDLAAITGGNCEVTENKKVVTYKGISVIGDSNLSEEISQHASILFGKNIENYIKILFTESGELDMENELVSASCLAHQNENIYKKNN